MKMVRVLLVSIGLFIFGCNSLAGGMSVERKYYLNQCIVKLNLKWDDAFEYARRVVVGKEIGEQLNRAIVSGEFPYFSAHTTRELNYYVLYYPDRCEARRRMTENIVSNYFVANIKDFPSYTIEDIGITPGFDGVIPSGWWKDE